MFGWIVGVDHQQDNCSLSYALQCPFDAHMLQRVGRIPDARRIDKPESDTLDVDRLLDQVSCSACDIRYECPFFIEQGVEQRGFADVRAADNGDGNAVFQDVAQPERVAQ